MLIWGTGLVIFVKLEKKEKEFKMKTPSVIRGLELLMQEGCNIWSDGSFQEKTEDMLEHPFGLYLPLDTSVRLVRVNEGEIKMVILYLNYLFHQSTEHGRHPIKLREAHKHFECEGREEVTFEVWSANTVILYPIECAENYLDHINDIKSIFLLLSEVYKLKPEIVRISIF